MHLGRTARACADGMVCRATSARSSPFIPSLPLGAQEAEAALRGAAAAGGGTKRSASGAAASGKSRWTGWRWTGPGLTRLGTSTDDAHGGYSCVWCTLQLIM